MEAAAVIARQGGLRRLVRGRKQGGAILVAGGANFPDKKPWEGGKKVWYDTVFVLETAGRRMEGRRQVAAASRLRRQRHASRTAWSASAAATRIGTTPMPFASNGETAN